jgi:hypothetical protein
VLVLRMVEERFHRDAEGRPIREGRTPPELLAEGEIEYRPCPYTGSRYLNERPMNVSALRQTSAHWDEIGLIEGELERTQDASAHRPSASASARSSPATPMTASCNVTSCLMGIGHHPTWRYLLHRAASPRSRDRRCRSSLVLMATSTSPVCR